MFVGKEREERMLMMVWAVENMWLMTCAKKRLDSTLDSHASRPILDGIQGSLHWLFYLVYKKLYRYDW